MNSKSKDMTSNIQRLQLRSLFQEYQFVLSGQEEDHKYVNDVLIYSLSNILDYTYMLNRKQLEKMIFSNSGKTISMDKLIKSFNQSNKTTNNSSHTLVIAKAISFRRQTLILARIFSEFCFIYNMFIYSNCSIVPLFPI